MGNSKKEGGCGGGDDGSCSQSKLILCLPGAFSLACCPFLVIPAKDLISRYIINISVLLMRKMVPRDMLPELTQLEDGLAQALNLLIEQKTFRGATEEGRERGLSGGEPGDQMGMESGAERGVRGGNAAPVTRGSARLGCGGVSGLFLR